jgi:mRNA interferase HigB
MRSRKAHSTKIIEQPTIEMKRIFAGNIDFVGSKTVIDCGGNKARFILVIRFQANVALIEAVLTHSEYDKSKWKD